MLTQDGFTTMRIGASRDGVVEVTLDRPDRLNAISARMFEELHELRRRADADDTLRVIVLTGAGRGFCAGLDLEEATGLHDRSVPDFLRGQSHGAEAIAGLRAMRVPVVAAVNGPAAGGGLALALASDVRVCSPDATFTVAFPRLGLTACDVGVSWLLPRIVGFGHASELMLTSRRIDAQEAERIGLVGRVVPADELLGAAHAVADEICSTSPFAAQLTKEGLQLAVDAPSLQAAIAIENRNQVLASRTEDMAEGIAAFLERRAPRYTGR